MDLGIITELSNYLGIKTEAVIELGNRLGDNPDLIKAMITGLATSFGKVAGESTLKQLDSNGGKLLDSAGKLTQQARQLLVPIARKYIENYTDRHGQLRVLGMGKPVSLESIYTQVNFDPEFIQTFQTIDTHEQAFRTRDWSKKDCRLGMKVANDTAYMMVLGGPGMGKSTFLRKVGLEALKQGRGEYQHTCIPVFLELRKYRWDKDTGINLQEKIAEEFQHCGLSEYQDCTKRLLEEGKLLILFDGLDEVPTELLGQMTGAIKDLVDRYSKNRFIASCRIAAYRSFQNFSRFTDVAIANFDELQIQCFIENWFKSHDRPEWGEECQKRLNNDDHKATRELAQTPLLLTLICILFLKRGEFPTKRSTLYAEAVWTLLAEWDASKDIVRQQPYKGLDTKCKEIMLAEIAYSNFTSNNLFFQQGEITQQIEQILQEMLTDEKRIDGRDVLRAVEEQHGLLVNRYEDIYSFSHLTIQEFLTAKHIIDNSIDISAIVKEHLCDKRWREVFLLLAGLRKADELLLAIDQEAMNYMATPKLQRLLAWVEEVADPIPGDFQPVGKRAIANIYAYACAQVSANTYQIGIANTYDIANAIANTYNIGNTYTYHIANFNIYATDIYKAIQYCINYAKKVAESEIYQGIDLIAAISKLEKLKNQIPDEKQPNEVHQDFARRVIKIFMASFHLTTEMVDLSWKEIQAYDNYLYGVRLLIECERAAVRRTPEVWSQIEERLLITAVTAK
jgi:NACHT domain